MEEQLERKRVLITGGAGSLGRAFINALKDKIDIIVFDTSEWAVAELRALHPDIEIHLRDFVEYRYNQHPVDVVIHLAAYKHVELGEVDPHSFIENNVTKTAKLFSECYKYDADILFISTDKAVEPVSAYGFTKALGEKLAHNYGGSVARLGNILSSSGSVIPIWEDAIKNEEPILITDPLMTRYVIEDIDAAMAIWKGFEEGKKLIVPPCRQVTVLDLAHETMARHGIEGNQYRPGIQIIGKRPGEKQDEKLKWDHEE